MSNLIIKILRKLKVVVKSLLSRESAWLYKNRLERMDANRNDIFEQSRTTFHSDRYRFASSSLKNKIVLDAACGTGYGSKILKDEGEAKIVIGLDYDFHTIKYATTKYSSEGIIFFYLGLPLWEWDEKLHYKHRPNITRYWSNNKNRPIIINEYGHHDYSFPLKKKNNELRILNLGDSITMGHGVSRDETYSKYMEEELSALLKNYDKIEVINDGVQGYSPFQELEVLKRSLILTRPCYSWFLS